MYGASPDSEVGDMPPRPPGIAAPGILYAQYTMYINILVNPRSNSILFCTNSIHISSIHKYFSSIIARSFLVNFTDLGFH